MSIWQILKIKFALWWLSLRLRKRVWLARLGKGMTFAVAAAAIATVLAIIVMGDTSGATMPGRPAIQRAEGGSW